MRRFTLGSFFALAASSDISLFPRRLERKELPGNSLLQCDGSQSQYGLCKTQACKADQNQKTIDGEWGDWSSWGVCSCDGVQERNRPIRRHAEYGGVIPTGAEVQAQFCMPECKANLPADCKVSEWSTWSDCSKPCDSGQQSRERKIVQSPTNCGNPCLASLKDTRVCNDQQCNTPIDCHLTEWGAWSGCDAACDGGQKFRIRTFKNLADRGGKGCEAILHEVAGCNTGCCKGREAVDCKWGDWTDWSACSASCDGGEMSRERSIKVAPRNGGKTCDASDLLIVAPCNQQPCNAKSPVDALWGDWAEWSPCTVTCDGGYQYRARQMRSTARNGGRGLEGPLQEFQRCNEASCTSGAIDCGFSEWSDWSGCSCPCNGHKERSRRIEQFAQNSGTECIGPLRTVAPCNVDSPVCRKDMPVDCEFGAWSQWSSCSTSCDGGERARTRGITKEAQNNGKPCEGPVKEMETCNPQACCPECESNRDCKWSDWQPWSACDVSCGGGQRSRYRHIAVNAKNHGIPCDLRNSVEVGACNSQVCGAASYCLWSLWSEFGECSVGCGGGTNMRQRHLYVTNEEPTSGGALATYMLTGYSHKLNVFGQYTTFIVGSSGLVFGVLVFTFLVSRLNKRRAVEDRFERDAPQE